MIYPGGDAQHQTHPDIASAALVDSSVTCSLSVELTRDGENMRLEKSSVRSATLLRCEDRSAGVRAPAAALPCGASVSMK